jgi:hypothetical protein
MQKANGSSKSSELAEFEKLLSESAKRTRELFSTAYNQAVMDEQARFATTKCRLMLLWKLSTNM